MLCCTQLRAEKGKEEEQRESRTCSPLGIGLRSLQSCLLVLGIFAETGTQVNEKVKPYLESIHFSLRHYCAQFRSIHMTKEATKSITETAISDSQRKGTSYTTFATEQNICGSSEKGLETNPHCLDVSFQPLDQCILECNFTGNSDEVCKAAGEGHPSLTAVTQPAAQDHWPDFEMFYY